MTLTEAYGLPGGTAGWGGFDQAADFVAEVFSGRAGAPLRSHDVQRASLDVTDAARTLNRPMMSARYTLEGDGGRTLEFAILMRERDAAGLEAMREDVPMLYPDVDPIAPVGPRYRDGAAGFPRAIFDLVAGSLRRAVHERTRLDWRLRPHAYEPSHLHVASTLHANRLEMVTCVFESAEGPPREVIFLFPDGAGGRLAHWEDDVVVVLRPQLTEVSLAPDYGGETVDEAVMAQIPVPVQAVLPGMSVTVAELARLRTGSVLPLDGGWSRLVKIRAAGRVLAAGELVVVGDRWGVLIQEMGAAAHEG